MKNIAKTLSQIKVDNPILESTLLIESKIEDRARTVTDYHFCRSQPKVRKNPHVAGLSRKALELLDLDYESVLEDKNTAEYLSGSKLLPNSQPICNNYCGHQFGNWARQLGDGRAHTLGSYFNKEKQIYELQLKGSGLSPFSRFADGNSVVSSALREFLVSEAMFGLGIPTTRAGSLVICQQMVKRDPFYNGNIKLENAAIVLRICPSFLRFGSFQICNEDAQCWKPDANSNREMIKALADFLIKFNYPSLLGADVDPYEGMFQQIVERSAKLVAKWQSVGFVHGVLNTDNMSMLGVTIDYGPFGFIDYFSKDFVSNATDDRQRYSYRQQPTTVKWNLNRLAEAMDTLVPATILKKHVSQEFDKIYFREYYMLMKEKLGLKSDVQCDSLIDELMDIMHEFSCNFTQTFRVLTGDIKNEEAVVNSLVEQSCPPEIHLAGIRAFPQMAHTPSQLIKQILQEDEGFNQYLFSDQKLRLAKKQQLVKVTTVEYIEQQKRLWSAWLKKYITFDRDVSLQLGVNPRYTLRNDVANRILKDLISLNAEKQPEFLSRVLEVFYNPYQLSQWFEEKYWTAKCDPTKLTCSS